MSAAGRLWSEVVPPLSETTLRTIRERFGFETMTPVQAAAIPLLLSHRDVVGEAVTGSGKTLAFGVPAVEILGRKKQASRGTRCLCVAPTRELAAQTARVLAELCEPHALVVATATGGESSGDPKGDVVVGTPGRLAESQLETRELEILVLDEADTLLDMGFAPQIGDILRRLPKQRRTALFSATQTRAVDELAKAGLRNPATVRVRLGTATPRELTNEVAVVPTAHKLACLVDVAARADKTLVFFDSCAAVEYFGLALKRVQQFPVDALHGKMTQKRRKAVWQTFATTQKMCLLCTDVAARGLDAAVDLVVQFDPPHAPETFVHRVGRTARAGRRGAALALLADHEDAYTELLRLRGVHVAETDPGDFEDAARELRDKVREAAIKDRALMELSTRAFTAHVKSYLEHRLKYIFRWEKVDIGATAKLYGLLKLPKMPEISKAKAEGRPIDFDRADVATARVPYADKVREQARQLRNAKPPKISVTRKRPAPPTDEHQKKKRKKKKGRNAQILEEWDDLAKEERLVKKLKKGKITKDDYYDALFRDDDDDDDDDGNDDDGRAANSQQRQRTKNIKKKTDLKNKRMAKYTAARARQTSSTKRRRR
ncbi:hypothetical protein CTAYLR_007751 [Chrysophaeum taylorii]|uniref:RNA helicase n=1 Tax=Chrysophaeum taylorii TaxID=2483200 RepID=A0AAD7UAI0_9STRA|nr:hypothetical protein CTAYLR_007751 [Chrysophaeum taylorii]